jgi:lysophospholipase L1-like esterase
MGHMKRIGIRTSALLSCSAGLHLLGCAAADPTPDVGSAQYNIDGDGTPQANFFSEMAPRFYTNYGEEAYVELTPDRDFIHEKEFGLVLDGCDSRDAQGRSPSVVDPNSPGASLQFDWVIVRDGSETEKHVPAFDACRITVPMREGGYRVYLTVTDTETFNENVVDKHVNVRNIVIVSIGDSIASGEGNPEVPSYRDFGLPFSYTEWYDPDCHRSKWSGHAQAARALEEADPDTSVTFVSLACTGSTIHEGLIPAQTDRLKQLFCDADGQNCEHIDALLLSIGGNDVHFGLVTKECASTGSDATGCVDDGTDLNAQIASDLDALEDNLDDVEAFRESLGGPQLFLMEYPDVFRDDTDAICDRFTFDRAVTEAISHNDYWDVSSEFFIPWNADIFHADLVKLNEVLYEPLLERLEETADEHGWIYVDGIRSAFATHGYCAEDTYIVQYKESAANQEDIRGTLHPNRKGHQEIAKKIADRVSNFVESKYDNSNELVAWYSESTMPEIPELRLQPAASRFDSPALWSKITGDVSLSLDTVDRTQGAASLTVQSNGFGELASNAFNVTDFLLVGDQVSVDLKLRDIVGDAWRWSTVRLYVSFPEQNIFHQYIGERSLSNCANPWAVNCTKPTGWFTVTLPFASSLNDALQSSSGTAQFYLAFNTPSGSVTRVGVDNLRFQSNGRLNPNARPWLQAPGSGPVCPSCASALPIARYQNSGAFGTTSESKLFVATGPILGWQASEVQGRTITINGHLMQPGQMPLPAAAADGKYYFQFSAGGVAWASWSHW